MGVHTTHVQAVVQHLLMEHVEYVPLELLLRTNRLAFEDYRAWREGRLETLDAVPADGAHESCAWLEAARSWACALGLAAEPAVHHGWAENAGTALVAPVELRLNALLGMQFRPFREHDQLDLFVDSAQTSAGNTLDDALTVRDVGETRDALERLVRIDRDPGQRFHATKLVSALEAPAPEGPEQGFERLERMEREWIPAASELLGRRRGRTRGRRTASGGFAWLMGRQRLPNLSRVGSGGGARSASIPPSRGAQGAALLTAECASPVPDRFNPGVPARCVLAGKRHTSTMREAWLVRTLTRITLPRAERSIP